METLLTLGGLGALGKYLNRSDNKQPREQTNLRSHISTTDMPNGRNVYDSKRSQTVKRDLLHHANDMYEQAECPNQTGVVPAFWKDRRVRTIDEDSCKRRYGDKSTNVIEEFNQQRPEKDPYGIIDPNEYKTMYPDRVNNPYFNNAYYVKKPFSVDQTMVGRCGNIDSNFTHQNMVPFFKGADSTNQMVDDRHLEEFTGQNVDRIEKRELQGLLFEPSKENPYHTDTNYIGLEDRCIPSIYRNDELPFEQTYVGKQNINGNGTYRLHTKNIDELRSRNNPKITFELEPTPGKNYVTKSGKVAAFTKNRPDRFRTQCISDLIVTKGLVTKPKIPDQYRPVHTHREGQNISYRGPLANSDIKRMAAYDYDDKPKATVKETAMYSTQDQNMVSQVEQKRLAAYDYDDKPATTMKELNMYSTQDQNMTSQVEQKRLAAYDYDDKPVTTMKELNLYTTGDTNRTNAAEQNPMPAYDYDDKPVTTMKELNLYTTGDTNRTNATEQKALPGHNYDDKPAATLKELTSNHQYSSNAHNQEFHKRKSYQACDNLFIKGLKGVTNVYRPPTQNGDKKPLGVEGMHIKAPKERLRWNKRIEKNKVWEPIKRVIPKQRNKREDSVVRTRFMPEQMNIDNDLVVNINRPMGGCRKYENVCD